VRVEPLRDEGGRIVGVVGVALDITERKRAEEALEIRARQQAAVAELGRRALELPEVEEVMGDAVSAVAGTLGVEYAQVLELLPDGDALLLRAGVGWRQGLVGTATVGARIDSQAGYTLLTSGPVIVEDLQTESRFSGSPLLREHGVASGMSVTIGGRDGPYGVLGAHTKGRRRFTGDDANFLQAIANVIATAIRRKGYEERLASEQAEAERLEELDRLRSEFVSSISHDLRTPLTSVRMGLNMLDMSAGDRLRPDERRLLTSAERSAERLRILIDGLLAYNQLEAGTLELERERLDLRTVVADAVGAVHLLLGEKGQGVEIDLPEPLLADGDQFRLGQVVINLLANAYEHTPRDTRVVVSGDRQGSQVRLSVSDDGPGIPSEHLASIFDRSYRLDRATGGSGLGLAICRGIVELHGGRIWAESAPGQGSTFHVALPAGGQDEEPWGR
jgi:signal transduction histidine kinase